MSMIAHKQTREKQLWFRLGLHGVHIKQEMRQRWWWQVIAPFPNGLGGGWGGVNGMVLLGGSTSVVAVLDMCQSQLNLATVHGGQERLATHKWPSLNQPILLG
jgi:hypothetical protein